MTGAGSYIAACTYYATMYQEDPAGIGVPSNFGSLSSGYAQIVQQTVWDVVKNYADASGKPWSGMNGSGSTVAVTSVKLNLDSIKLTTGQTADLVATVQPANASNKAVSWSSSTTGVASVNSSGRVTGVSAGTATITVTTQDGGTTAQCRVLVTSGTAVTGVTISPAADTVLVGQTITLRATVSPANATDASVTWRSSDTSCATVNQPGVVTGRNTGGVTIMATTVSGGKTAACAVTVSIVNTPPVAVIEATPQSGMAPLTVSFDGTGSHDADAGDFVLGYDWSFGDGGVASSNSSMHTYGNPGVYIVKLVAMDSRQVRGDTARVTITVTANPNAPVSLSRGRTAVASSSESTTNGMYDLPASNAVDGDPATRWGSVMGSDTEWIYVDLGASQRFDLVVLRWEAAYAAQYKLRTSPDGSTWTDIFTQNSGDGGVDSIYTSGITARYVRMLGIKRGTQYGFSLWEFEVYRAPAATTLRQDTGSRLSTGMNRVMHTYDLRGVRIPAHGSQISVAGILIVKQQGAEVRLKVRTARP